MRPEWASTMKELTENHYVSFETMQMCNTVQHYYTLLTVIMHSKNFYFIITFKLLYLLNMITKDN